MKDKDKLDVLFAYDRCIYLNDLNKNNAKEILSKRILTNKDIKIELKESIDSADDDFVTNMIVDSYFNLCCEKEDFSFSELMYEDFSAKMYHIFISDIPNLDKVSKSYDDKNAKYMKDSLRIKNNVNISLFKKENFDEKYGIITNIYKDLSSSDISIVGCEFHYKDELNFSYGREEGFESAERSSILELIERISMYNIEGNIISTSYENRGSYNFVDPEKLLFYQDTIHNSRQKFDKKQEYKWLEVDEYFSFRKAWIPTQFFSMNVEGEPLFVYESSNGVALGTSLHEAKLFALFEFVERDAFLNFWYSKARLYRIDINSITDGVKEKIGKFETESKKVYLFDMTFDVLIPCILCLVVDSIGKVSTYISTACHPNYNVAINAAVNECLVGHRIYENNPQIGKKKYNSDYDIVEMFDHVSNASQKHYIENYRFLFDSEVKTVDELYKTDEFLIDDEIDNAKDLLDFLCNNKLSEQGEIYFADLTTKLSYRYGFYIAKIIVSDMLTMTFGYKDQRINKRRIMRARRNSKYVNRCICKGGEINDAAHPFP